MKKMKFLLIGHLLLYVLIYFSCEGSLNSIQNDTIQGIWVQGSYSEDLTILHKLNALDEHKYGFIFYPDGRFVERKNVGWCGTPPVTYGNYEGIWNKISENMYQIEVGYWGGTTKYQIEVVSIDFTTLKIKYYFAD